MIILLLISFFLLLILGTPIYVVLGASSILVLAVFGMAPLEIGVQRMMAGVDKFTLVAIPFFILAANIMASGGIARRLVNFARLLVGHFRGGLGFATVLASMFFGAVSGSSPATVASIGKPLYPSLIKEKYPVNLSSGLIITSGSLGIIIPPSVTMIIYGAVTGSSVGELFIGGIGAGVFFGLVLMIYVYFMARKNDIKKLNKPSGKAVLKGLLDSIWGLGIPIIILGGIYGGIFTPTEAAGVSVIYALIVTMFIYREVTYKELYEIIADSVKVTVQVMIIIGSASIFSWVITSSGFADEVVDMVFGLTTETLGILLLINLFFLIGGMFLDGSSLILILAPILVPIGLQAGIDPIFLGVLITVNCAIGMFTPPFGLNIFVGSSVTDLSVATVSRSTIPFVFITLIILVLLILFPQIILWLPSTI